jgi:hypothetical protein
MHDAGIVDENVYVTERVDRGGHEIVGVQSPRDIGPHEARVAQLRDKSASAFSPFSNVDIGDHDPGAVAQETLGNGIADTAWPLRSRSHICRPVPWRSPVCPGRGL